MGNVFEPECAVPQYLMKSTDMARKCGRINGAFLGLGLGLFIAAMVGTQVAASAKARDPRSHWQAKAAGAAVAAALLAVLFGAWLGGALAAVGKRGADAQVAGFEHSGMTKSQAISSVETLQNNERTANAIAGAGMDVAAGLMNAGNGFNGGLNNMGMNLPM